ncbi:MAG: FKBP-type peptidyl-prolyl cis-trans isomerase [Clostridia bacterium]|nr:FKBP-type peptidyl-prolyl cis-trans isomerase [Clostridia bacterium]
MKRILSLVLILGLMLTCFAGCAKKEKRELYNVDLGKYVTLGEYKGLKVDKKSDEFKKISEDIIASDVQTYGLYVTKNEGKVKEGDNVNIDYTGKKDGVAFEGGTAQAYNLVIGSDSFIDGFEDGLIGKEIGSTVDLNLTFPKNYGNEELNGQDVVFTVKINYVTTTEAKKPKDYYTFLGFSKLEDYEANIEERAIGESLQQAVLNASKIKDYPKEDLDFLYGKYYEQFENTLVNNYQATVEQYLTSIGQTADQLKEQLITNQVKPIMDMQMVWYAIFDKEELKITDEEKEQTIKEMIASGGDSSVTRADIIEEYGEYYIEMVLVSNEVFDLVKKNAKIS